MARAMMLSCARRGMTIVELTIGLMITGMVMASLAAVWSALGDSWSSTGSSQQVVLTANQAVLRLEDAIRQSKYVCQYSTGTGNAGTYVLLWKSDNWAALPATAPDGQPQLAELVLIEHSAADQRIYAYEAISSSAMNTSQKTRAAGVATWSDLTAVSTPAAIKTYDFVRKKTIAEGVSSISFNVPQMTTGAKQVIEFSLQVSRGGSSTVVYGTATLRAPGSKPS